MKMRRIHSANNSTDQEATMRGNASNADRRQTLTDRRQIELPTQDTIGDNTHGMTGEKSHGMTDDKTI